MTASVLKQDPNTKRFKRTLICLLLCVRVIINKCSFERFCVWLANFAGLAGLAWVNFTKKISVSAIHVSAGDYWS